MGMSIDEAIKKLSQSVVVIGCENWMGARDLALETIRKYQRIQAIVKEWREVGLDYDSCDAMDNIERVIENGKV